MEIVPYLIFILPNVEHLFLKILFLIELAFILISFILLTFTDPGIIPRSSIFEIIYGYTPFPF